MLPWLCEIRTHQHSTETEAAWCTELYEQWQTAMGQLKAMSRNDQEALSALMAMVRRDEVEDAVNQAYAEAMMDDGEDDRLDVR